MILSILLRRLLDKLDPRTWLRSLSGKPRRRSSAPEGGGRGPVVIRKPNKENHGVGGGNIDIDDKVQTGPG